MKSFDVVGYAIDCNIYCPGCSDAEVRRDGDPIFVGSEWDYYPVCDECGGEIDEVDLTEDGWNWLTEREGPQDDDYTLSPTGALGAQTVVAQGGEHLGDFDTDDAALAFVHEHANAEKFWPNVWSVSDHGNAHLVADAFAPVDA